MPVFITAEPEARGLKQSVSLAHRTCRDPISKHPSHIVKLSETIYLYLYLYLYLYMYLSVCLALQALKSVTSYIS